MALSVKNISYRRSSGKEVSYLRIEGWRETKKALIDIGVSGDEIKPIMLKAAELVASRVQAPTRTGKLQASIKGYGAIRKARIKAGSARAPYGKAISLGKYFPNSGKRTKPNPYLREARDAAMPAVVELMNDEYGKLIRKHKFKERGL